ncbi:MAG: flagellar motor switch protein FliM [Phycisphaerales bacterium]|nr:MAG: flagellar motor switch protein FliM [Phycisphaerales bacterium]
MTDILDQSDIDALLSAVTTGEIEEETAEAQIFSRYRRDLESVEIKEYDFKRPERISKDQMRALQTLHETFARNFGASLSGFLRTIVEVRVAHAEQMTYSEFISSLPNPTSFNLVDSDDLDGQMCLELSPLIIYPIIDRLLGGASHDLFIPQRAMTLIETRLIHRILERGMTALAEAWESVRKIDFRLGDMESNPQIVQMVPPNEVVVVIGFEIKMTNRAGTMSLCIPFNVIEPLMDDLSAQNWALAGRLRSDRRWGRLIVDRLADARLDAAGVLAETTITMAELRELAVGDVITTDKPASSPVTLSAEGIPKFLAHIGQFKGNRALRILRPIQPPDRG